MRKGIFAATCRIKGKGYRIYYSKEAETIVLLLCGDDKHGQTETFKWRYVIGKTIKQVTNYARTSL